MLHGYNYYMLYDICINLKDVQGVSKNVPITKLLLGWIFAKL